MNVLLIYPNMGVVTGEPPIGIGYLTACLKAKGIPVGVVDTTFHPSFDRIESAIRKDAPDIVGIYSSTVMLKDAVRTARLAKELGTRLVVLGGPHVSVEPESTLTGSLADAAVIGEAEYSFPLLVDSFLKGKSLAELADLPNTAVKIDGVVRWNGKRHYIDDLDSLPHPDRDVFDMRKYMARWFQLDGVSSNLRGTNIYTTRSCPFSCAFCQPTLKTMFGHKIRRRSPVHIAGELRLLKDKYGVNAVQIVDDLLFTDESYIEGFCRELIRSGVGTVWGGQSRIDTVPDDRILSLSRQAGLRLMCLGIESATQRILDLYKKGIRLTDVKRVIDRIRAQGIKTRGYFIIGAPTETAEDIERTIDLAVGLRLDEAAFSILTPFPGTHMNDIARDRGWEINRDWNYDHYYKKGGFLNEVLSDEQIRRYQRLAFLKFYLHPHRLPYVVHSALNPLKAIAKFKCYLS
ncbi:MAG TPA: radical SAM protein [Elusimicrobiota bacterium]|nr:radical SAM protein [Elusimicrobiota bacterium]